MQYGKGHHILYPIFNTGQKLISTIKFSSMRAGGKVGRKFLLVKLDAIVDRFLTDSNKRNEGTSGCAHTCMHNTIGGGNITLIWVYKCTRRLENTKAIKPG